MSRVLKSSTSIYFRYCGGIEFHNGMLELVNKAKKMSYVFSYTNRIGV
jgi:hypothetical protein